MKQFQVYRNYRSEKKYYNMVDGTSSRLDELHAGLLRVKLKHPDELYEERASICSKYLKEIKKSENFLCENKLY